MRFAVFALALPLLAIASPIAKIDTDLVERDAFAAAEPVLFLDIEARTSGKCHNERKAKKDELQKWKKWHDEKCEHEQKRLKKEFEEWEAHHKKTCTHECKETYKKKHEEYQKKKKALKEKCDHEEYQKEHEYETWENHHKKTCKD